MHEDANGRTITNVFLLCFFLFSEVLCAVVQVSSVPFNLNDEMQMF